MFSFHFPLRHPAWSPVSSSSPGWLPQRPDAKLGLEMPFTIILGIPLTPLCSLWDLLLPRPWNILFLDVQHVCKEARDISSHEMQVDFPTLCSPWRSLCGFSFTSGLGHPKEGPGFQGPSWCQGPRTFSREPLPPPWKFSSSLCSVWWLGEARKIVGK